MYFVLWHVLRHDVVPPKSPKINWWPSNHGPKSPRLRTERICPPKSSRWEGARAGSSRRQELDDARIWLLLLVGSGLMDGRGRSELFSVCSAGAQVQRPYLQLATY
ncbi:hypothetical protein APTSU1_000161100 [Apodemus speciosus]|uniref:Uncharacterized protein n=1 Tax=Apodemus speciosus TaxID=105296 RepID=A0ABQ0EHU9_APOSI